MTLSNVINIVFYILSAYLIGSIPFAWIMVRILRNEDIRKKGTGNVGGGNVMKVISPLTGALVILLDMGKGFLVAWAGYTLIRSTPLLILMCLAVILGHCYSIFLKFQGGKGVATAGGVLFVMNWKLFLIAYLCWAVLKVLTKWENGPTILLFVLYPLLLWYTHMGSREIILSAFVALLIVYNHLVVKPKKAA